MLTVSPSPHDHAPDTVRRIMLDVAVALVPACMAALYFFGVRAALLLVVCVGTALAVEALCRLAMGRPQTLRDGSALVTGILLALNLPPDLPLWQAALGAVVAIAIAKQLFGGLGKNPFNPALVGRAFLLISFTGAMTTWSPSDWRRDAASPEREVQSLQGATCTADATTTATPLGTAKAFFAATASPDGRTAASSATPSPDGRTAAPSATASPDGRTAAPSATESPDGRTAAPSATASPDGRTAASSATASPDGRTAAPSAAASPDGRTAAPSATASPDGRTVFGLPKQPFAWDAALRRRMFLGDVNGCIGETSALALLLGGLFLLWRRVITWHVPVAYLGTVAVYAAIAHAISPATTMPADFHLLAGGLMLGALFMATDMVTTPVTHSGLLVFGVGCGLLTMIIRTVPGGSYPEGVSFAILIMNATTPLINRATRPRAFGTRR